MKKRKTNRQEKRRRERRSDRILTAVVFVGIILLCIAIGVMVYILRKSPFENEQKKKTNTEVSIEIKAERIDKSKLEKLVKETEEIDKKYYTEKSVKNLEKCVDEAEECLDKKARQKELEKSYRNIVEAIQNLEKKEKKTT